MLQPHVPELSRPLSSAPTQLQPPRPCGTSVNKMLFAEAQLLMSEPGSTVSKASPMNPGWGTAVKQE